MMKKEEILARVLVGLLILLAVALPIGGYWLANHTGPQRVELHARMPENGGWSSDTIEAKVGQPLDLHITSDDVVHGFAVGRSDQPDLEIVPGAFTDTSLTFDRPGKYTFYCTRWCGPNHWRMRGTIEVSGDGPALPLDPQPLYLKLGIDIDAPQPAQTVPAQTASAARGSQFADLLPAYALDRETYLASSPAQVWLRLRAEPALSKRSDDELWDAVAWIWQQQAPPQAASTGQALYTTNCAACHGETGKGNGVMVRGLHTRKPGSSVAAGMGSPTMGAGRFSPPDFTDPRQLLGASPALLEGKILRGGMGTGMPYWGPIFTPAQVDALVAYLYEFAWGALSGK